MSARMFGAAWVAIMGLYMLISREQLVRQLAEYGTWGQRNKERAYARQLRVLRVAFPLVGGFFLLAGLGGILSELV